MHTLINLEAYQSLLRNGLVLICLICISILFLKESQSVKKNWAIFYATLWLAVSLIIVNYLCVDWHFWSFSNNNSLKIPLDLYFVWIVFWGILPVYFFKGKHILQIFILLACFDLIFMIELEKFGILKLHKNWLIGEILLLTLVWLPSYFWARISYYKTHLKIRALFQVLIMTLFFTVILPQLLNVYLRNNVLFYKLNPYLLQIGFIIVFPALIAVQDLIIKGFGTPFPYDKTTKLVSSGVYAYCRNPIQWSFTLLFIPLSIYYQTYILLIGSVVSILYTITISNPQEYNDMQKRFKTDWLNYKNNVPNWYFLWKPKHIPNGKIYFKNKCNQCEGLKAWFENRKSYNLTTLYSKEFTKNTLLQVTYVDNNGTEFKSLKALSYALEHINLAYACLGWFIRFPVIYTVLQTIIDSMDFENEQLNGEN